MNFCSWWLCFLLEEAAGERPTKIACKLEYHNAPKEIPTMTDGALSEEAAATGHFGKKKQLHSRRGSGLLHVLTFDDDGQGASLGWTPHARLCHI